jgi:hypothetical protein
MPDVFIFLGGLGVFILLVFFVGMMFVLKMFNMLSGETTLQDAESTSEGMPKCTTPLESSRTLTKKYINDEEY